VIEYVVGNGPGSNRDSAPMCIVSTYCAYWHLVDPCLCDQTMIMKMHSYMAMSDYLQYVSQQSAETMTQLRNATVCVGGWEKVIYEAKQ